MYTLFRNVLCLLSLHVHVSMKIHVCCVLMYTLLGLCYVYTYTLMKIRLVGFFVNVLLFSICCTLSYTYLFNDFNGQSFFLLLVIKIVQIWNVSYFGHCGLKLSRKKITKLKKKKKRNPIVYKIVIKVDLPINDLKNIWFFRWWGGVVGFAGTFPQMS